ncbi:MAG: hypothetical protein ACO2PO_23010 [Candidatus Calescibacterium sp.]
MRKLVIIDEKDVREFDIDSIKRNIGGEIFIWKANYDERELIKIVRKYDYLIVLKDKYLYETLELLKNEKPFSLFNFDVKYLSGEFYKRYTLRNNLGKYLYEALRTRAGK